MCTLLGDLNAFVNCTVYVFAVSFVNSLAQFFLFSLLASSSFKLCIDSSSSTFSSAQYGSWVSRCLCIHKVYRGREREREGREEADIIFTSFFASALSPTRLGFLVQSQTHTYTHTHITVVKNSWDAFFQPFCRISPKNAFCLQGKYINKRASYINLIIPLLLSNL